MPSTYTNTGIELIADGEQDGVWGATTNTNMQIVNRLTSEAGTITLSGTTHTLTLTNGALSEGQYAVLVFGGSPTGTNTVTISPNTARRVFIVKNSSGESVVLTQGSGGNVTVADGAEAIVYCDGGGASAAVADVTTTFLRSSNNLSDLADAATALTNLGITATAAELNKLDGATLDIAAVTAVASEVNVLDGITATTAELNLLDGVTWTLTDYNTLTSTAAELNLLDGVTWTLTDYNTLTSTAAELNLLDGKTLSGSDTEIVTGTAGSNGDLVQWNADGDLVSYGAATQAEATWETGTATTESLVSPAKIRAAIKAAATEVSEVATTSSTAVDIITGIPSGINTVELYFYDISISAADFITIQLGTSGGFVTSGYIGQVTQGSAGATVTTGIPAVYTVTAAGTGTNSGLMRLHRVPGTNKWVAGAEVALTSSSGSISLASALTQVRVTTNGGTATFDNGGISARYY